MSLLQDKKNFSLKEHTDLFLSNDIPSQPQIDEIISKPQHLPLSFSQLFQPNNHLPINHITNEIEIFNPSIYQNISQCHTPLGHIFTHKIINSPSTNSQILSQRQTLLQTICQNFSSNINNQLSSINTSLNDALWFFKPKNEHSDYIYNMMFFNSSYLKFLNKYEPFLTISNAYKIIISPIMTAASPLLYIIIPFVLMKLMKIPIPFKIFIKLLWHQSGMISLPFVKNPLMSTLLKWFSKCLSVFLYCQNVYSSYSTSKVTNNIVNIFQNKLKNLKELLGLHGKILENEHFCGIVGKKDYPKNFGRIEKTNYDNFSIVSNKGKILKDFYEFMENKEEFIKVLNNIGFIDCYFNLAKILRDKSYFTIPKMIESSTPTIKLSGIWHPAIPKEKNIKNNIEFNKSKRNYLLTGPNAAGKSTFIKSVFLNIYLAQTLGICNAEEMSYTPFVYLLTGIRNQDSQGKESLFEAEVHKIRDYLELVKNRAEKGFTFSILDEMFTSTNYNEGFSASYGLCETIGMMKNSLHIVASHYTNLYRLEKKSILGFKNVKFSVKFEGENIKFPYKLEDGYSKQFIALKLLKEKNCDNEFMENCIKCLKKITHKKKKKKVIV